MKRDVQKQKISLAHTSKLDELLQRIIHEGLIAQSGKVYIYSYLKTNHKIELETAQSVNELP
jgi:hypothetical protein